MKVILETSLFEDPNTIKLDALAKLALDGWHRLLFAEEEAPAVLVWLGGLDVTHREQWLAIVREGYTLEAREPARHSIRVGADSSTNWTLAPPFLTIDDACRFLGRPFVALLEDSVSDRSFLLRMATAEQRKALLLSEKAGLLTFQHGGGISSMPRMIDRWLAEGPHGHLRRWAIFDSDALRPSEPSPQSEFLKDKCQAAGVPHHQLKRRCIENYITPFALNCWTYGPGPKKQRAKKFQAFLTLSTSQRAHFNMKDGFRGDRGRSGAGDLFDGVSDVNRASLDDGFGGDVGNIFASDVVKEEHLRKEHVWDEMNAVVTDLIAHLR